MKLQVEVGTYIWMVLYKPGLYIIEGIKGFGDGEGNQGGKKK